MNCSVNIRFFMSGFNLGPGTERAENLETYEVHGYSKTFIDQVRMNKLETADLTHHFL